MRNLSLFPAAAMLTVAMTTSNGIGSDKLSDLVDPKEKVVKLSGGFRFTEGPACDKNGTLYFSDIPNSRIHKWSLDGKLSTYRQMKSGTNGLYFDNDGNLVVCHNGARRVIRIAKDGKVTVIADDYNGKKLNSPNDVWVAPNGGIYFTDPRYGSMADLQQNGFHVYYVQPKGGKAIRIIDDLKKPNGIIGTANGKHLYVADPGANKTWRYEITDDGSVKNRKLAAPSGSDGLTLDENGNLYITRRAVVIFSPTGEKIGEIKVPESPSNVTFGGRDGHTLFITARTGLYSIKMKVKGQK